MNKNAAEVYRALKSNRYTVGVSQIARELYHQRLNRRSFTFHGSFYDRSNACAKLCVVLAGYKEFLYPSVMKRLEHFLEKDIDVCIATSGKYSDSIARLCKENSWSYLSTKENNVSLVQNVAIQMHPAAEYIFKLDEDIFITEGYFRKMEEAYQRAENSSYVVGAIAPLIPINGYGNRRVLEITGLVKDYESKFEKPLFDAGPHRQIECNPLAAQYMWDNINIDELNRYVATLPKIENPCAIRFSIGALLFKRSMWKAMEYWPVKRHSTSMGVDEEWINNYCSQKSRPIMVSDNVVAGHLAFGPQNDYMKKYYLNNCSVFSIKH